VRNAPTDRSTARADSHNSHPIPPATPRTSQDPQDCHLRRPCQTIASNLGFSPCREGVLRGAESHCEHVPNSLFSDHEDSFDGEWIQERYRLVCLPIPVADPAFCPGSRFHTCERNRTTISRFITSVASNALRSCHCSTSRYAKCDVHNYSCAFE
jgi:hypothetical protein